MGQMGGLTAIGRALGRGVFPHQFSFLLELPVRQLVLSPRELIRRLKLKRDDRVLEIGSGSGFYSVQIAANCGGVVLLDLQPEMLIKARSKAAHASMHPVGFVSADASRLPFASNSFDVVCMVSVFGEVSHQQDLILETHRVLKPNGIVSISEHLPDPDFTRFSKVEALVRSHAFALEGRAGQSWAYTANFKRV